MRRARRIVLGLVATLAGTVTLAVLVMAGLLWNTLPPLRQALQLAGLHHPVEISLDEHGVPHITAADLVDAATAIGYVHARDRMFQMELMRRVGSGRIAELAGPGGLPIDRMTRTLGLRHLAEASYPMLPRDVRDQLDAYARGVNAAIEARGRFIAPEFLLLGRPEPWTPVDTLLWGRLMGLSLAENWHTELARLGAATHVPPDRLLQLRPEHPDTPAPDAARDDPGLRTLARRLAAALPRFPAPYTLPEEASDEWAVDGAHSVTGAPLLAGDPHLAFGFPSIWYLARISVPGHVLTGATAPGTPFLVIGQNGHIAWTFTSSSADVQDLFIETPLTDGRTYATPSGAQPFLVRTERIHVRGAPDVVLTVRTTRHGPVISDILPASGAQHVIAAEMENLRPDDASPGLAALDVADDIEAAGKAAALISEPVQNLLVADHSRIALFTTGHVPIRRGGDGSVPSDGASGTHDWIGDASGRALPTIVAPASGHVLNGNERTAPPDFPVFMGRDWPAPWRATRIRELLDAMPKHDVAGFTRMQTDRVSAYARHLLPLLLARDIHAAPGSLQARARDLLRDWNGSMDPDRPQPLIFNAWVQRFVGDVLQRDGLDPGVTAGWEDLADLLLGPSGGTWCKGDCMRMLSDALRESTRAVAASEGDDPTAWRWGHVHHAVFDNAFLRAIPGLGRLARGEVAIGGDDSTLLRGGSGILGDFIARHGASYRGDYDLADPERSRFIVSPGQSGNWVSRSAWNLMQIWAEGSTISIGQIPRRTTATISLRP
ncbi:penicillin acylase family protein [Lichenicola sp.]|uniref:penicillin acylase family protein n=1 Tax=Lichenicola sp. TaxID=2804529 RepID=UPI003B006ACF